MHRFSLVIVMWCVTCRHISQQYGCRFCRRRNSTSDIYTDNVPPAPLCRHCIPVHSTWAHSYRCLSRSYYTACLWFQMTPAWRFVRSNQMSWPGRQVHSLLPASPPSPVEPAVDGCLSDVEWPLWPTDISIWGRRRWSWCPEGPSSRSLQSKTQKHHGICTSSLKNP